MRSGGTISTGWMLRGMLAAREIRPPGMDKTTHFGFKDVAASEKAGLVRGVFDSVADNYDIRSFMMS